MPLPLRTVDRMAGRLRPTFAILALVGGLTAVPVAAQTTPTATPTALADPAAAYQPLVPPAGMTIQAYQGVSCIALGLVTTFGVFIYSDVITEALTGAVVNPVLLIPVMALGFASGCSVGSTMSPGLLWLSQQFH